jgi:hypothetical protein
MRAKEKVKMSKEKNKYFNHKSKIEEKAADTGPKTSVVETIVTDSVR